MKKIMSKILVVAIVLSMLIPTIVFANESQLSDITNHWGKDNIEAMVSMDLISGYPDGTFKPDKTISNAEFITIVYKAMKKLKLELNSSISLSLTGNRNPGSPTDPNYKSEHWASDVHAYMVWHKLGGEDFSREELDEPITRYSMAKILVRTLEAFKEPYTQINGISSIMSDYETVYNNGVYRYFVEQAFMKGIISGKTPEGLFDGEATGTRAEASTMILRSIDKSRRLNVVVKTKVPRTITVLDENDSTVKDVLNLDWENKGVIQIEDRKRQFEIQNGILDVANSTNIEFDYANPVMTFTVDEWVALPNFTYKGIEYETSIGSNQDEWLIRKTPLTIYLTDPHRPLVPIEGDTVVDAADKSTILKKGPSGVLGHRQGIDYYSGITFANGNVFIEDMLGTASMGYRGQTYLVDNENTGEGHFTSQWVKISNYEKEQAVKTMGHPKEEGTRYGDWMVYRYGVWGWAGPNN